MTSCGNAGIIKEIIAKFSPEGEAALNRQDKLFPPPVFTRALGLGPGDVVSIIGCGGKTSLMNRLATENRDKTVLLSTTTKIRRPGSDILDRTLEAGERPRTGVNLLCGDGDQKIGGLPPDELAPYLPEEGLALFEADGSRNLPLKGWADYEPVIPAQTTVTIGLCTVWAVGLPCSEEIVHRLPLFTRLTGAAEGCEITLEHIAAMVGGKGGMFEKARGRRLVLVNRVESEEAMALAEDLAGLLPGFAVFAASIKTGRVTRIDKKG